MEPGGRRTPCPPRALCPPPLPPWVWTSAGPSLGRPSSAGMRFKQSESEPHPTGLKMTESASSSARVTVSASAPLGKAPSSFVPFRPLGPLRRLQKAARGGPTFVAPPHALPQAMDDPIACRSRPDPTTDPPHRASLREEPSSGAAGGGGVAGVLGVGTWPRGIASNGPRQTWGGGLIHRNDAPSQRHGGAG